MCLSYPLRQHQIEVASLREENYKYKKDVDKMMAEIAKMRKVTESSFDRFLSYWTLRDCDFIFLLRSTL